MPIIIFGISFKTEWKRLRFCAAMTMTFRGERNMLRVLGRTRSMRPPFCAQAWISWTSLPNWLMRGNWSLILDLSYLWREQGKHKLLGLCVPCQICLSHMTTLSDSYQHLACLICWYWTYSLTTCHKRKEKRLVPKCAQTPWVLCVHMGYLHLKASLHARPLKIPLSRGIILLAKKKLLFKKKNLKSLGWKLFP